MKISSLLYKLLWIGTFLLSMLLHSMEAFAPPRLTNTRHGLRIHHEKRHVSKDSLIFFTSPDDDHNEPPQPHHVERSVASIRSAVASTLMGLLLLCSPPSWQQHDHYSFLPPPTAWAVEEEQQVLQPVAAAAAAELPPPETLAVPPLPNQEKAALTVLQPTPPKPVPEQYSPIDEVWTLVDKYFIDKSFGGQDWKAVKLKYKAMESTTDDEQRMKLVTEMVKSLGDKYSRVLDRKQYAAIQKFDLIGVGVTLMPDSEKRIVVGAPPVAGSASDQAGMKVGDYIVAVNGVPTESKSAFDIIDQISDNPNARTITMTVRRQGPDDLTGEGHTREVTMERAFQEVSNPIRYKISERRKDGTKVGFIRVLEFNSLVKAKLEDAFENLAKEGANAFVIDLRGNPGGAFQSAVEISSLFVDDRVATYVLDSNGVELPFRTAAGRVTVDPKAPLAIWVDGGSASASEVFAGSLHDNCRAVVMGGQSFGKGLIQAVYGLKNGAGLVLTVARYVTPNGTEIQGAGVTPDIKGNVPPFIPGLSTDTSKVDFRDISKRLDPSMCQVPEQR